MKITVVTLLTLLASGCAPKFDERLYRSHEGDQTVVLKHQSCGAGCNSKDQLHLKFNALDGTAGDTELATIHGAAKIEIDWMDNQHLVIGACNASSAAIKSDIVRLNKSQESTTTEVILTTVALSIQGKTYCAGF